MSDKPGFMSFTYSRTSDISDAAFRPFGEELKPVLKDYLAGKKYVGSDYSYYAYIQWFSEGEYCDTGNVLYLRARMDGGLYYWPPLVKEGCGVSVEQAAAALPADACFAFCTEEFVTATYGGYYIYTHRDWAEYIYKASDFIALAGKRYHAKRNHIAKFTKNYFSTMERLKEEDIPDIVNFERAWLEARDFDGSAEESAARESSIVKGWIRAALRGELVCDILRVDGRMAGIAIGEITPTGTAIEMYEKADTSYEGVYSYLAHEFAARNFAECEYINRQEDMGLEGLRKSKMSYYPAFLLEKFVLKPAAVYSDCYAERVSRLNARLLDRVGIPRARFDVRELAAEDYDAVYSFLEGERGKLDNKLFFLNYTPEELRGVLTHGTMLGAFDGERLIATCAVDRDREYGAKLAEICGDRSGAQYYEFSGIMTAEDYRGRGVSATLCRDAIAYARRELSPCTLCAVVQYDNAPSLNNLKALGFSAVVTKPYNEYTFTYLTLSV